MKSNGNKESNENREQKLRRGQRRFTITMQRKLVVLFLFVLIAFVGLGMRIYAITRDNGEEYKRQVLSQQSYDSETIPYKRGTITDAKGTILATSTQVFNVIIDAKAMLEKEDYLAPTLAAISSVLDLDSDEIRDYVNDHPDSQYYIAAKNSPYEQKNAFDEAQSEDGNIQGVWFEAAYIRSYPNGTLASDVIGFTNGSNSGSFGLEEYYNDTLNGKTGRVYGYLDDMSNLERTTIDATNGNNLVTTIDANVQSIVEKYLKKFNDEHENKVREGKGARNIGAIVMEVDTGNILAMASYPNFDLNDPQNTEPLIGMNKLDETDSPTDEVLTAEDVEAFTDEEKSRYLNALWNNFCIATPFEPGSTAKPFTVASALDAGAITGNETYLCEGYLEVGGHQIYCHNRYGDGLLTVGETIERSCNVGLMYIAMAQGIDTFTEYQSRFNFGLRTNIDLAGEARTAELLYSADTMQAADLATNSFGQNFNVTMIQMITGFCSLINGGNYYEPHVVSKITSPSGATVENIEPRVLKKTVSESVSEKIREYCLQVVTGENGTGKTARPAGYLIGGKTGTAETLPRGNGEYIVSFIGYAPADDPQIAIYVVVDRANEEAQDDAKYATGIVRNILTEILPYLNIYMTEELSEEERAELEELQLSDTLALGRDADVSGNSASGTTGEGAGEGVSGEGESGEGSQTGASGQEGASENASTAATANEIWKTFETDPETGYKVDPNTGALVDPDTGYVFGGSVLDESSSPGSAAGSTASGESGESAGAASSAEISGEGTAAASPEEAQE
ncbi:MAG: penicillin-binding transpeptidase domain-containing protein [Eubacteriales bacterium]|nr:penicillin-binding transpeptidase domain-containing protein [Eubacteriales bacterium]